jgi:hypothetical protein
MPACLHLNVQLPQYFNSSSHTLNTPVYPGVVARAVCLATTYNLPWNVEAYPPLVFGFPSTWRCRLYAPGFGKQWCCTAYSLRYLHLRDCKPSLDYIGRRAARLIVYPGKIIHHCLPTTQLDHLSHSIHSLPTVITSHQFNTSNLDAYNSRQPARFPIYSAHCPGSRKYPSRSLLTTPATCFLYRKCLV